MRLLAGGLHNTHSKYNFEFSVCLEAGPKKRKQGRPEGPLERHNGRLYDHVGEQYFAKDEGEASWIRLCQIMDMTEGGWLQQQECEEDGPRANNKHENNGEEDA